MQVSLLIATNVQRVLSPVIEPDHPSHAPGFTRTDARKNLLHPNSYPFQLCANLSTGVGFSTTTTHNMNPMPGFNMPEAEPRFLREATDVVQTEVSKLSLHRRNAFSAFDSLVNLAERHAKQDFPDDVVSTALITIIRLGDLILLNNPRIFEDPETAVHSLGLCMGLLPAAVAAVSRNTEDLLKFGLEILAISVRLTEGIRSRSQKIEAIPGTWAYTVVGAGTEDSKAILDDFHQTQNLPDHKRAFIGVASRTWTTIFGPPSTLDKLWAHSPQLGLAPKLRLNAFSAVHASHWPMLDMERIIGESSMLMTPLTSKVRIVSSSTCAPFVASNLGTLLYKMILDIAQNTLRLTDTVQTIVSDLRKIGDVDLVVLGPTAHTSLLQSALREKYVNVKLITEPEAPASTRELRGGSDLVAIVGLFDSRLFNVSPREAAQMDPLQRLLLMTSFEAMQMAGYAPDGSFSTNTKRIATYMAQTTDDWRTINECQGVDIYYVPGVARAFTPGRLNYHFKWEGASHCIDAACAGGTTAVTLACSALLARECDTALAGGGSILTAPAGFSGLCRGGFLSPTGNCKPLRDDADGYCRGEGVGVVVLKRLEDAIADNDNIQAVIHSSARSYSADAASITQPHADSQAKLYRRVLQGASIDPLDVGYVEMHGTGTQWGDLMEVQSISEVFAEGRTKEYPLVIGAVKANVGHGEAAAGITSLIKNVMMFQEPEAIPPQPGWPFKLNPKLPRLDKMNIKVADGNTSFIPRPTGDGKKRLLLNNFDASGGNTCIVLSEPPERPQKRRDPRTNHVVACSARTSYSLQANKERLLQYLQSDEKVAISDVAYTTTARRMHDIFRSSYVAQTLKDLIQLISNDLKQPTVANPKSSSGHNRVVFAFTGQGSLYPGMGKQLFETSASFRENIFSYQKICDSQGLPYVVDIIADDSADIESKNTAQIQLAIVFIELALGDLWKSWGIQPSLLIGHSLGEYAALCISGVLSVSDVLYLVGKRSSMIMEKCIPGSSGMLAIAAPVKTIEETLANHDLASCEISCMNAPEMSVVSGTHKDLKSLQVLMNAKIRTTFLKVTYGFHSAQIDPILKDLETSALGIHFAKPQIPVASTLIGDIVSDVGTFNPEYLARQAREPVNFSGALRACKSNGFVDDQTLWMEIGPDPVCLGLVRSTLEIPSERLLPTLKSNEENWKTISNAVARAYLSKQPVAWSDFHHEYIGSLTLLELPTYAFDLKDYWSPFRQEMLGSGAHQTPSKLPAPTGPERKPLGMTCVQWVEKESFKNDEISATFSSHTSEPKLFAAIQGHLVDGTAICPATVFCDMAYTAAKYLYEGANPGKAVPSMSLWALEITHPIVVPISDPLQIIDISAVKSAGRDWSVRVSFHTKEGASSHEHGSCDVHFGKNDERKAEFSRSLHLVKKRVDALTNSAIAGLNHRLQRPIIYKLFASLVDYGEKYRGLEEVYLDNTGYGDTAARVKLGPNADSGAFTESPYWTDAIIHLAGFLLNGDVALPPDDVYISAGFEAFHIFEELSDRKIYTTYVSMQPSEKPNIVAGDVYVFDGGRLVALCGGLYFQKMTKKVLKIIFGQGGQAPAKRTVQPKTAAPKSTALIQQKTQATSTETSKKLSLPDSDASSAYDSSGSGTNESSRPSSVDYDDEPDVVEALLAVVAAETGFEAADMEPSTEFADIGLDSLMGIAIISAVKRDINLDLPATFFTDNSTVADVMKELGKTPPAPAVETRSAKVKEAPATAHAPSTKYMANDPEAQKEIDAILTPDSSGESSPAQPIVIPAIPVKHTISSPKTTPSRKQAPKSVVPNYCSNVVLIRGKRSSKETPLMLITDGAGSAAAYIHLPAMKTGTPIYALESPFLSDPHAYKCSVEEVCALFVEALQKTQPKGPYIVGGWSAGAIYAYEVARQLLEAGEKLLGLMLIDMRVPRAMPDALQPSMELIESAGLFTGVERAGQGTSDQGMKQKQHLVSTVNALVFYTPRPFNPSNIPNHTTLIWAQKGLSEAGRENVLRLPTGEGSEMVEELGVANMGQGLDDPEDLKADVKSWFFAKRNAFGPNGWDKLVRSKVDCHVINGADHFSMVVQPKVKELGKILEDAVRKCTTDGD
ncbi:MAG: hypothetical protein ASARMPREDX12_000532 [Alectoria sarmentosa]|nr:MAG: hypothetical protein ASARMPREDX12_000532 [Alectoria sarmentosa]